MTLTEIQKRAQFLSDNFEYKAISLEGDCSIISVKSDYTMEGKFVTHIMIRRLKDETTIS